MTTHSTKKAPKIEHGFKKGDKFFRYVNPLAYLGNRVPELREYVVVKVTPKGVWIDTAGDGIFSPISQRKFVLAGSRKAYAYPTKEKALAAYTYRKRKHVQHLRRNLSMAMDCLNWAERQAGEEPSKEPTREIQEMRDRAESMRWSYGEY